MAPVGKLFEKVRLPEIARESGCHYIVSCTVSKPSLVEKVIRNAVLVAREIGPTYIQLYTPCILEIGKDSMEGLQDMRDSESRTSGLRLRNMSANRRRRCSLTSAPRRRSRRRRQSS
jgi:pyruvate ferredoxin oxidoreductase beta subunit